MPSSNKSTFSFYDKEGNVYPFYARNSNEAITMALTWGRRMGIKLYRRKK